MGHCPSTYHYMGRGFLDIENVACMLCCCGALAPPPPLGVSAFDGLLLNLSIFISICVLHSTLCLRKCVVDISDCQMSRVGLGIIKWRQDYKALTVIYWRPPLYFV